jgi:adenylate cyclase
MALGLAVMLALILHAARVFEIGLLNQIEALGYDARVRLTMPRTRDERIVIVDIDEKSLAEEGRWPWGRDRLARMMDTLFDDYRAAVVGFDVVFAERDESSGLAVLRMLERSDLKEVPEFRTALSRLAPGLDWDAQFAQKLRNRPVVLGYYFTGHDDAGKAMISGMLPAPIFPQDAFRGRDIPFVTATGYGANLPDLQNAVSGAGHLNPAYDFDGVVRRVPMLIRFRGATYEALSLAVARAYLGVARVAASPPDAQDYTAVEWLQIGQRRIPVDENVSAMVPYRGPQGSFRYVSATDVLHGRLSAADFAGRIVLVGTTAPGLQDLRTTPVANVYPGVEIQASMVAGILDRNVKLKPAYVLGAELLTLFAVGALLALALPFLSPLWASALTLAVAGTTIGGNLAAWQYGNIVLPIASPLLLIVLLFGINMSWGFFVEARAKRRITTLFGQYVPPDLVDEMSRHPEACTMEGESRHMTVLFSDVRDFTRISEGLDPKQLSLMMNEYLGAMTQVIHTHRGTIDKYIGDAIMAFWGAPLRDGEHARHALLAAMEMQSAIQTLAPQFKARGWPELKVGIGLNSGAMNVGNMGSPFRRAYTVMGDAVNLAARLESLTKQYGVAIMVGDAVRAAVPEVAFRELDRVRVKGKTEPVTIHEPLGLKGRLEEGALRDSGHFHTMLEHYRAQRWDDAMAILNALPHAAICELYRTRIEHFNTNPPGRDWDGVFTFETK